MDSIHTKIFLGIATAILSFFLAYSNGMNIAPAATLGITLLCAFWWVTEPIPIPATSLLPLALFPLTGILDGKQVAMAYGHPLILLLLGGFMLSKAIEKSGAHKRMALSMIQLCGSHSAPRVLAGFMVASAGLSMWISNTATTLMLLPVAIAVLEKNTDQKFTIALLLGIAYAASIGGIGTVIGTPPNLLFRSVYQEVTLTEFSFTDWMKIGLPVVLLFLPIAWLWLKKGIKTDTSFYIPTPGKWRTEEIRVLTVFAITALLWITRNEPFGGWSHLFNMKNANDASIALLMAALMFMIPDGKNGRLLDWETANKIPWGVLILFGGGICIAQAFQQSGLSTLMGEQLKILLTLPIWLVIPFICLFITFVTEVTSNTATTALMMPILAATAIAADIEPALLMIPAAMSASCAFMLPVATAPNTVVFSSGKLTIKMMARKGLILNLVGVVIISTVCLITLDR